MKHSMTRRRFLEDSMLAAAGVASPLPAWIQENKAARLAGQANPQSITEDQHPVQALALDAPDESLNDTTQMRCHG